MRKYLFLIIIFTLFRCKEPSKNESETVLTTKDEYLKFVNKARTTGRNCGTQTFAAAKAVTWNDNLEKAALLHSKDMYDNKYFAHISKTGSDPSQRILEQNYNYQSFAENIFTASGFTPSPEQVVDQWIASPPHCVNIMTPDFKEMAVGEYKNYWTQLFGTK